MNTWREHTDYLTARQISDLAAMEAAWGSEPGGAVQLYLQACEHVEGNRTDTRFAHIPPPAGAVRVQHWHHVAHRWQREFECRQWNVGGVAVWIDGRQYADGTITARVYVEDTPNRDPLDADGARRLAVVLCEAAAMVDRLVGDSPPF